MKLLVLFIALAAVSAQNCMPNNIYLLRHAERYLPYLSGPTEAEGSSVLRGLGYERSDDLRDMFTSGLFAMPDQIFISSLSYSFQTAMPLALSTGLPVTVYRNGNRFEPQLEFLERLHEQNPCPESLLIVNHGFFIADIMRTLNFTGLIPSDVGEYGRFYQFAPNSNQFIVQNFYPPNDPGEGPPLPAPCVPIPFEPKGKW